MSLLELQQVYNILIKREKKAEKYLENNSIAQETRDKWLPAFTDITEQLSLLMRKHREITGNNMTDMEVLNGFK